MPTDPIRPNRLALILVEVLVVVAMLSLLTAVAMLSFGAIWGNTEFKKQSEKLMNTFQMAQEAAGQSDRRYAVILDFLEQRYVLRQFASLELDVIPDQEAIIDIGFFTDSFQLDYVIYDDMEDTREKEGVTEARFYAGHSGWQYGGKVVVRDRDGNPWSIFIRRMVGPVEIYEGDVDSTDWLKPKGYDEIRF